MNIGNSAGINFSGLASGIDTESIISKLIAVENIGVQRIQQRQAQLKQRMDVFGQLRTQMSSLSSSANLLANAFSLSSTSASVANSDIATITTGANTPTGSFSLNVKKLAMASKVASIAITDSPDLNFEGNFKINDKTISVAKTDSLSDIATKINDANAGAGATVITGSDGKAYLTLTATKTGLANAVKLTEGSGDILVSLGFMTKSGGSTTSGTSMTGSSVGVSSASGLLDAQFGLGNAKGVPADVATLNENLLRLGKDPVAFRAGYTANPTQTISIGGKELSYNPQRESLDSLASRITKELGADAKVVAGNGGFHIKLSGVDTSTIKDSMGLFEGKLTTTVVPPTYSVNTASQVITAQDADFTIDGIRITSAENTNTTAIKGATITLLKADATGATSTNVSIARSFDQGKSLIKSFTDSYNALQDFLGQATQFDKESFATAPLFGDAIANQLETEIANVVSGQIPGLSGNYRSLANIGITFGEKGQISVDEAKMSEALTADPTAITRLFQPSGQITGDALTYVSSTDKTKSSASGNYAINITRAATKASVHKDIIASGLSQDGLTLGIKGGGLNSDISLQFSPGASIDSIISTINADDRLKDNFEAVKDAQGRLQITSKRYGAAGGFTVTASTDSRGTPNDLLEAGVDVAGTINGEAATGAGQFLTGNKDNLKTEGLQIQYTGTATGSVGSIQYTRGAAALMTDRLSAYTLTKTGVLSANDGSLQEQYDDFTSQIADFKLRVSSKEQSIRAKFQVMEAAIQRAQSQGSQLTAMFAKASSG